MAIVSVQRNAADDAAAITHTLALSATTAGSTILVGMRVNNTADDSQVSTVVIGAGGANRTFSRVRRQFGISTVRNLECWILENAAAGETLITVTLLASFIMRWGAVEVTGLQSSSSVDGSNSASSTGTALDSGSVTASQATGFLFCIGASELPETFTLGSSFSNLASATRYGQEERILSSSGTYNGVMSMGASDNWACLVVAVKGPSAGLSGSQLAYKQARFGLMRFGASRFNYFAYNPVVTINGTNRTAYVVMDSLSITQALNDEPDTARFRVSQSASFTISAGQTVAIALGSSNNYEFAGQVVRIGREYDQAVNIFFTTVDCIDYGRLLDRRLVLAEYTSTSATDIALDLLANFTSGFTAHGVAAGLPTIDNFPVTNETVQGALKRLANLITGGFYVDAYRDVHLFGSAGDVAPNAGTNPLTISDTSSTTPARVKAFRYTADVSQLRTRVIVEGQQTTCPIGSPGNTASATQVSIDYLVVGGGGSGGVSSGINGGGGGGGVAEGSTAVVSGALAVVIGAGGSAAGAGASGVGSSFGAITTVGGGRGSTDSGTGSAGGCGGGGCGNRPSPQTGGAGTSGQGYAGGTGGYWFDTGSELFFSDGGGGGGAGSVGGNGQVNLNDSGIPGNGGAGRLSSINGTPTYYGGGGAGGSGSGSASGGVGGGGAAGVAGTANTGGGGGATAAGGSGLVIVRYRTGDLSATGGTITTSGVYTIHTFTANGTFTITTVTITLPPVAITDFPLADGSKIDDVAGTVRVGNHAYSYTGVLGPTLDPGENPPGVTLNADAAAGASSLTVVSDATTTITEATGWLKAAEQYIRFTGVSATTITIPATGYGALAAPLKSGAALTWVNALQIASTTFDPPFPSGTVVVQRVTVDDASAQSTVTGIEGGDGIHEQIISDGRLSLTGAQGRGTSDLSTFSTATGIIEAEWVTDDLNARPGRQQAVSFAGLTDTLMITRVDITFPVPGILPIRRCAASSLKQPGLYDVVLTQGS